MTARSVHHAPEWQPTQLRHDAAGNTKPGFECGHELENGNGQCGGNVFDLADACGDHCCIVDDAPAPTNDPPRLPDTPAYTVALSDLAKRVNGFVYPGDRLEAVLATVRHLRADPTLAALLLTDEPEETS